MSPLPTLVVRRVHTVFLTVSFKFLRGLGSYSEFIGHIGYSVEACVCWVLERGRDSVVPVGLPEKERVLRGNFG